MLELEALRFVELIPQRVRDGLGDLSPAIGTGRVKLSMPRRMMLRSVVLAPTLSSA